MYLSRISIIDYLFSYTNFPVKIVNDLAGWLANIIIPVADYFILQDTGESPYDPPLSPNFDSYFSHSAPDADLFGNADAIGIWKAYQVLLDVNPPEKLNLSDVFILYYKGLTYLQNHNDNNITIPVNPVQDYYTVDDRWKIFSLFFGFMAKDNNNNYYWVPDFPEWNNVKNNYSATNPQGRNYDNRMFHFAEFWITRRKQKSDLGFALLKNTAYPTSKISRFNNINDFNQPVNWVNNKIIESFELKFLPFIRALTPI